MPDLTASDKNACLLNETAARRIGWKNPLGKNVYFWGRQLKVIGIVRDFHSASLHNEMKPYIMISALGEGVDNLFSIRFSPHSHNRQETIQYALDTFSKFFPGDQYVHQFLTDNMDRITYDILNGVMKTFGFFT